MPPHAFYGIHRNYTLVVGSSSFMNEMTGYNLFEYVQVVGYSLPFQSPVLPFHLVDGKYNLSYPSSTRVLSIPNRMNRLGVCAYVSDFNSVSEVRSWLTYYHMVGVDHVMLYAALPLTNLKQSLQSFIASEFLRWYDFFWPLNTYHKFIQRSIQRAQVNSCYYRHRHEFEYLIMVDVDEYMMSYSHPFDLYQSIRGVWKDSVDVLYIKSNMYTATHRVNREHLLQSGRLFDVYNCWLDNKLTGRNKMIIRTQSKGFYGIHDCSSCRFSHLNQRDLHIFHIKEKLPKNVKGITCGNNHTHLTPLFQEALKHGV